MRRVGWIVAMAWTLAGASWAAGPKTAAPKAGPPPECNVGQMAELVKEVRDRMPPDTWMSRLTVRDERGRLEGYALELQGTNAVVKELRGSKLFRGVTLLKGGAIENRGDIAVIPFAVDLGLAHPEAAPAPAVTHNDGLAVALVGTLAALAQKAGLKAFLEPGTHSAAGGYGRISTKLDLQGPSDAVYKLLRAVGALKMPVRVGALSLVLPENAALPLQAELTVETAWLLAPEPAAAAPGPTP
jgi:hypothetical protein